MTDGREGARPLLGREVGSSELCDEWPFCLARRALERFRGTDFAEIFERALRKVMDEVEGDIALEWQELDALLFFGPHGLKQAPAKEIAAAVSEGLIKQRELELLYWKLDGKKHEPRPRRLRAGTGGDGVPPLSWGDICGNADALRGASRASLFFRNLGQTRLRCASARFAPG